MQLTIRRVGGMLPTLRPSRTHDLGALDAALRDEVLAFIKGLARAKAAAHAEAMSYVFEITGGVGPLASLKASAPFSAIPEALRALLPGPTNG